MEVNDTADKPNKHARALSKMGASKGGKARASVLTPEERKEIASKAIRTRWARKKGIPLEEVGQQVSDSPDQVFELPIAKRADVLGKPLSLFQGELKIGDVTFPAHVLDDGRRVISQREVVGLLTGHVKGGIQRYLGASSISRFVDPKRIAEKTVEFLIPGNQARALGYEGTLLVEICDAYLKARDENLLTSQQLHLAKKADIIIRACAKVGIIALIDEATGYQKVREKNALRLKLQAFIAEDMQEWARMFPEEFFLELARLENVHYSPRNRPLRWGRYVMAFVYYAFDRDVAQELKRRTPDPHYRQNLHQWLRELGREKVSAQLYQVLGIMKTCRDMAEFRKKFAFVFKKEPYQLTFFDLVDIYQLT